MKILNWFKRPPDFIVGGADNPYMLRWWIIPRNPIFNIYLHKFLRDDDDRALHCHPWVSLSIIIKGSYIEYLADGRRRHCGRWSIIPRRAIHRHRIQLQKRIHTRAVKTGLVEHELCPPIMIGFEDVPAWTIFITGPRLRQWGFWCEGTRFVPWQVFTSPADKGKVGRGCE